MRFPTKGTNIDEDKSSKLLQLAIDNDVNYFDTAV
ncbi:MAG: hypothetical protein HQ446_09050, partial [Polaromonas sp.]|nr:hypothetical protein [Polaromonas sp.]